VKTTLEVPDTVFRKAKATAAERGQSLGAFVTDALREKLARRQAGSLRAAPWLRGFGKLRALKKDSSKIRARIDREFEVIEPKDRT
jgi:hypothetical protein